MAFLSMGPISSSPISAIPGARTPQSLTLNLNDTVGVSDLISIVGSNAFTFNDPVSAVDDFSRAVTYARSFADSAGTSDALAKSFTRQRAIGDAANASDAIVTFRARTLALNDLVAAVDVLAKGQQYGRVLSDYVVAHDTTGLARALLFHDEVGTDDDTSLKPVRHIAEFVTALDHITLTLTRTDVHLTAEPDLSYVASVAGSHCYRLDAVASSQLFIDSVEEYSPEETRSPAYATE